jgi:Tol biopolymer transport system component
MKVLKPALVLIIVIAFAAANLYADEPRLGVRIFENGQYPQTIGKTGKISFYSYSTVDDKTRTEIVMGDPKTGKTEKVNLDFEDLPPFGTMAWAKDGRRFAVVRQDLTPCDIYEYTLDNPPKITKLSDMTPLIVELKPEFKEQMKIEDDMLINAIHLDWSFDDSKIAMTIIKVTDLAVWVMNVEDGKFRQVTEKKFGSSPCWAPDNETLYIGGLGISGNIKSDDIFSVKMEDYSVDTVISTPAMEMYPRVSPDGRYLVYTYKERTGRQTIYVYDLEKKKAAPLVILGDKGSAAYPVWSGDGKAVYYQYISGKRFPDIYKIDFDSKVFE